MMYTGKNPIIIELQKHSRSEWPRFYCTLNTWETPEELTHLKIDREYGDSRPDICETMEYIEKEVGKKPTSHYWNTIHRKDPNIMTDAEFEIWWENGGKRESTTRFTTLQNLFRS